MSNTAVDWIPATIGDSGYYPPYSLPPLTPQVGTFDNVIGGAGAMQSANYTTGLSGWTINGDGSAEFNNVTVRGTLTAGKIDIPDTTTAASFHVDATGKMWSGSNAANFATAPFSVDASGNLIATTATLNGNLTMANSGKIRTASSGLRLELSSVNKDRVDFFSGNVNETTNAALVVTSGGLMELTSASISSGSQSNLVLTASGGLRASINSGTTSGYGQLGVDANGSFLATGIGGSYAQYALAAIFGRTSALSGSAPSVGGGQFFIQCGTTVVATNAGGGISLSFPSAFPNGLVTFLALNGDVGVDHAMFIVPNMAGTVNASGVDSTVYHWDGATFSTLNSTTIRYNWIAIGF